MPNFNFHSFAIAIAILLPKVGLLDWSVFGLFFLAVAFRWNQVAISCDSEKKLVFFLLFLQFLIGCVSLVANSSVAENIFYRPLRVVLLIFLLSTFFTGKKSIDFTGALQIIYYAALINGLVILMQYILHMTNLSKNFLIMPDFDEQVNVVFRKPGLVAGYPIAGLVELFGIFSAVAISKLKNVRLPYMPLGLLFVALFLTSRTELYIFLVVLLVYFFMCLYRCKYKPILTIVGFATSFAILFAFLLEQGYVHLDTYNVMLEAFINAAGGKFGTESSDAVIESWRFAVNNFGTIIFGNGLQNSDDMLNTLDDGFQINFFGGGVFYLLFLYLIFFLVMRRVYIYAKGYRIANLVLLIPLVFLINEIKGAVIFSRVVTDFILVLYAAASSLELSNSSKCKKRA